MSNGVHQPPRQPSPQQAMQVQPRQADAPPPPLMPLPTTWNVGVMTRPDGQGDPLIQILTHTPAGVTGVLVPPESVEKLIAVLTEHVAAARNRTPAKKPDLAVPVKKLVVPGSGTWK
jgi:hypothetical protein